MLVNVVGYVSVRETDRTEVGWAHVIKHEIFITLFVITRRYIACSDIEGLIHVSYSKYHPSKILEKHSEQACTD